MAALPQGKGDSAKRSALRARVARLQGEVTADQRSAAGARARILALEVDEKDTSGGLLRRQARSRPLNKPFAASWISRTAEFRILGSNSEFWIRETWNK